MRKLTLLLLLLLCASFGRIYANDGVNIEVENQLHQAVRQSKGIPTVRAILVICDNYASSENNAIAKGVRVDLSTVSQMLNILEKRGIAVVEKTIVQGSQATMPNIITAIKNVKSNPDDVIFFYFSGHGGMDNGKSFLLTAEEKFLPRAEVQNLVSAKSSRLKMIITDACNNEVNNMTASRSLSTGAVDAQEGKFDAIYKDLFYNYQGMMHISASSEGEYAWANEDMGGFFTHYFVKEGLIKHPANSWEALFGFARDKTIQMFNKLPAQDRSELAAQGIKSQTAKAFVMPSANSAVNTNTQIQTNKAKPAMISIQNFTTQKVTFYIDHNTDMANWTADKLEEKSVAPNTTLKLTTEVTVGFVSGKEDKYYDLETGKFFFETDDYGKLDLFREEEGKTNEEVSHRDYRRLLTGIWEWESVDGMVTTNMSGVGTFSEQTNGQTISRGKWFVDKEVDEEEGESYPIVRFVMRGENNSETEMRYVIMTEDNDDQVQLIYYATLVNGEVISTIEDEDEEFNPVLVMYRK